MVSQSEDRWANHALEEWVCKNLKTNSDKNILVLSKSKGLASSPPNITATFIGKDLLSVPGYPESLVYSCLPPGLPMSRLPRPAQGQLEEGCYSLTVTVELADDVKDDCVMDAMQNIGEGYVTTGPPTADGFARLSLVRPDDGWFPGIGKIQADLEDAVQKIELKRKRGVVKKVKSKEGGWEFELVNSYGH